MHSLDKIQRDNAEATRASGSILDAELERILSEPHQVNVTYETDPEFEGPVEARLVLCRQGKVGDGYVSHFTSIDEVTDEMVGRFKEAWHEADEAGLDGSRVLAGLRAVFEVVILDAESVPE